MNANLRSVRQGDGNPFPCPVFKVFFFSVKMFSGVGVCRRTSPAEKIGKGVLP